MIATAVGNTPPSRHVVAVTGAAGFIGRHVCRQLAADGQTVVGIDLAPSPEPADSSLGWMQMDLSDPELLAQGLAGRSVDVVIHAAWLGHPRSAGRDYVSQIRGGLIPTATTTLAAGLAGIGHVVLLGSGGGQATVDANGVLPAYGWAKGAAAAVAQTTADAFGYGLTVIRPSAVYGPGQDPRKGLGAVTTFAAAMVRGEPIRIFGDDTVTRDFLHVADLSEAVSRAVSFRPLGEFDLGGPAPVSLGELVEALEGALGRLSLIHISEPTRPY